MKYHINRDIITGTYVYEFWTGPEGIDYYTGHATSLGQVFELIITQENQNSLHYVDSH